MRPAVSDTAADVPAGTTIPYPSGEPAAALHDGDALDVVVIGGGGAGLSAAVYAAIAGLRVAVIERTDRVGGTTAWTAGTTWVPGTHHAAEVDAADTRADAAAFLDAAVGPHAPAALRETFLDLGPEAVAVMEAGSSVQYVARKVHPDYLTQLPGSRLAGRALEPTTFDGARLGERLALVRDPLPEFTAFGGMSIERDDIGHLAGARPTEESRRHLLALRRAYRDAVAEHGRDTRRTMGNALIAGLLHTLDERRVPVLTRSEVTSVTRRQTGWDVLVDEDGTTRRVTARNLVIGSGGFNRHPGRRAALLPGLDVSWCPGAPGHTGQAHDLVDRLGGHYGTAGFAHTFYAPVSTRRREDGSWAVFPHFVMDRAKPHMVVVDQHGRRYVNEATSYHLFGKQMVMHEHEDPGSAAPSFLITDATGMWTYGLGMVRPFQRERALRRYLDDGYLVRADSLTELAERLDVPADNLERTIAHTNTSAARGEDPEFHRGLNDYQRFNGDPASETGHPNIAPVDGAPYFAVRIYPGDIGASTGFETDATAAVLGADGAPIGGVYAVGNDMQSVMGGTYPAPGITIGPGLVFAYAAVRAIVGGDPLPGAQTRRPLAGW
ncbi:FAD-binding dehydrogenase [Tersicoccus solisilvae]|uniref:FAD-binding dehydrogenase n=1 Tax=Tersicoccus solisilvae TaxID=1882339 RepID=A0ABQ1PHZ3_9MICC|nr:FAD-dependent oxidoreductase [Tersicoccus solisilvae]GGC97411.1 FAD-binding dehydrogenase [Tersicoccus solisilvae]